ncbi:hypothetical protein L484_005519 [Morus notabilis]|uniref:TITAN-like protein n=1 Tax=Morus notabilis TaxID=981085 RepID=W9RMD8_9ROSA|nr:hypothetical protein L484_005519 [Morus notabilis]
MAAAKSETIPNPSCTDPSKKDEKKRKKVSEFEYCKVCKLNHDQGQRHKYFPSHKKSLSIFFSKFQTKLSDVGFFLRNPSLLRSEHASRNRVWCVFCDMDIDELGSEFACENAINHLASADHMKNLKHFLWKYGGGMDFIDKFRIKEAEVAKWKKKCKSLKSEAESSNKAPDDIHNELNYVSHSGLSEVANAGLYSADVASSSALETHSGTSSIDFSTGMPNITQIFVPEVAGGNVHTGAPPPWFDAIEESQLNVGPQPVLGSFLSSSNNSGKSKKLNPKRVGAAWAERRKMEMEMEKRGELVKKEFDANWLPNFGRVWQSGSRKESRKEFEFEKQNLSKVGSQPAEPVEILPYISKRIKSEERQPLSEVESQPAETVKIQPYISKRMEFELGKQKLAKVESEPAGPVKIQPYISKRMELQLEKQKLPKVESESAEPIKIQPYISKRMMYANTDGCSSFIKEMEANECVAHGYVLQVTDDTGGS